MRGKMCSGKLMKCCNIPIFVPHEGCPFDCLFCNQRKITGRDTPVTAESVSEIIEEHLATMPRNERHVEIAFFGGSFTGISAEKQTELLRAAYRYVKDGRADGIRVSTRPDYISEEILDRLAKYGVSSIELGVQSMDDRVLSAAHRGHTAQTVVNAVNLIRKYPFRLGLQMMTGLPEDTDERAVETARKIIGLKPDFVRIYPTLVLKDTALERLYLSGSYVPQTLDNAVNLCKKLLLLFRENDIEVIRVALVTTDEICENGGAVAAGPFHSAFRELAEGEIYFDGMTALLTENPEAAGFCVNPRDVSRAVGIGKKNTARIKERFGRDIKIVPDAGVDRGSIRIWKE